MSERRSRKPIDYAALDYDDEDDFQDSGSSSSQERIKPKTKNKKEKPRTASPKAGEVKTKDPKKMKQKLLQPVVALKEVKVENNVVDRRSIPRRSLDEKRFDRELELALTLSRSSTVDDVGPEDLLGDEKEIPIVQPQNSLVVEGDSEDNDPLRTAAPPSASPTETDAPSPVSRSEQKEEVGPTRRRTKSGENGQIVKTKERLGEENEKRGSKRERTGDVSDDELDVKSGKKQKMATTERRRRPSGKCIADTDDEVDAKEKLEPQKGKRKTASKIEDSDNEDDFDDDENFSDDSDFGTAKKKKSKKPSKRPKTKEKGKTKAVASRPDESGVKTVNGASGVKTGRNVVATPRTIASKLSPITPKSSPLVTPRPSPLVTPSSPAPSSLLRGKVVSSLQSPSPSPRITSFSSPLTPRTQNPRFQPLTPSPGGSSVILPPGKCNIASPASIKHGLSRNARIKPLLSCIKRPDATP